MAVVAAYARYSTIKQNPLSIDDQFRIAERLAIAHTESSITYRFCDPEISAALWIRPGLQQLLEAVRRGEIDVVVAESVDRLSRDSEDMARIGKLLRYRNVRIFTKEGEIDEVKIAVLAMLGSMYLKNISEKTWRGLEGTVLAGKVAGGRAYGYRNEWLTDEHDQPIMTKKGQASGLCIDEEAAKIIRRIFRMFANGESSIAIAKVLNSERIPSPRGQQWNASTIRGDPKKLVGILNNPLYRGELVWNRRQWRRNPEDEHRRRQYQLRSEDAWIRVEAPDLRIVDEASWEAVQLELKRRQRVSAVDDGGKPSVVRAKRAQHLLSGQIKCGVCGSNYVISGKDYYRCAAQKERGTCANTTSVRQAPLEEAVLAGLQDELLTPAMAKLFVTEFNREVALASHDGDDRAKRDNADLAALEAKIDRLVSALMDGVASASVKSKLAELEAEKAVLQARAKEAQGPASPIQLSGEQLASLFATQVRRLRDALNAPEIRTEATATLQRLIGRVVIHSDGDDGPDGGDRLNSVEDRPDQVELELVAETATLINFAQTNKAPGSDASEGFCSSTKVVAGAGFEPA
ncbi:MAG: recombinase family protein, partial [Sphingomonadaceae bacterium]|nr:recombinase family protein [Sphingomonadaceae bacterium]